MATKPVSLKESLGQLENMLNEYFGKKAPSMPANIKELLVKVAPYLTILGVIVAVPAILGILGVGAVAGMGSWYLGIVFLLITVVMEVLAIPGLFARTKQGWNWIFYSVLANTVYMVVSLNIIGLVIGTVLGMYVLFQVRSAYR